MNQFDAAAALEMAERDLAIAAARQWQSGPKATGRCLWCDEPAAEGLRWCPATNPGESCMAEWEYAESRRRSCGGAR